jgi:FO synthase
VRDDVTFVRNRNINYTNVCTFKCTVLRLLEGPTLSEPPRRALPAQSLDDIAERVREAVDLGATEVCLQGGIHPDFDGDYYMRRGSQAVKDSGPRRCMSTASPRSRSPKEPAGWGSRWRRTCSG